MTKIKFSKGTPLQFRATTAFHLGDVERNIEREDVVLFDGYTLTLNDENFVLPRLRSAVQAGWLVPAEDEDTVYRPQPAGVKVHAAESRGEYRTERVEMATVQEEEAVVSSHSSAHLGQRNGEPVKASRGMPIQSAAENDATPVARLSSPNKTSKITDAAAAEAEARRLDTSEVRRVVVQKTSSEDDDVFGDVSTPLPEPGIAGEGQDPHLTPVEREAKARAAAERAEAARQARLAAAKADEASRGTASDQADPQKLEMIRSLLPDFQWDMSAHWKTRVKDAVDQYGDNAPYLNAIKMIETSTVVEYIDKALENR